MNRQLRRLLRRLTPGELFLMKYEDSQQYGGPEEGGWWYNLGIPQWKFGIFLPLPREWRYAICRYFNGRIKKHNDSQEYDYTSVLSYRSTFYSYGLEDSLVPNTPHRPHYE